jgi:hypothetical protein
VRDVMSQKRGRPVAAVLAWAVVVPVVAVAALYSGAAPAGAAGPRSWNVVPSPNATAEAAVDSTLSGVSCTGASFCMAVGSWDNGNPGGLVQALAEEWNGSTWSVVPITSPPDDTWSPLTAVSCAGPTACVAVGSTGGNPSETIPYAEIWNGTTWSMQYASPALPLPPTGIRGQLDGVSCTAAATCMAVGSWESVAAVPQAFALTLSGTTWTVSTPQTVGTQSVLTAVSCASSTTCMAVGSQSGSGGVLVEQWNAGTWTVLATAPTADIPATGPASLDGVSCGSATACMAVGSYPSSGSVQPFGLSWNGTTFSGSTVTGAESPSTFAGVSCISSVGCTAVGPQNTAGAAPVVVADWTGGATWQVLPNQTSTLPAVPYALDSVSCVPEVSCSAVGDSRPSGDLVTLAMTGAAVEGGYYLVAADGGIFCYGSAQFYGSTGGITLNKPIVGMAVTADDQGYWLVGADGGIFSFGDAAFYGSTGGITLNKPIVGMAVTPDGQGYWLVGADGGIFSFGDAAFYGSTGGITLNKPIVGMAPTADGHGYYLVASDGGIFSYGDAAFYGSEGGATLNKPIVGMAVDVSGLQSGGIGYWMVGADGGIFSFQAPFFGSTGGITLNKPIVGMAATPDGQGYWLVGADGGIFNYGDAAFYGSTAGITLNQPIVGMAAV